MMHRDLAGNIGNRMTADSRTSEATLVVDFGAAELNRLLTTADGSPQRGNRPSAKFS